MTALNRREKLIIVEPRAESSKDKSLWLHEVKM